jgi:hypothetical protein
MAAGKETGQKDCSMKTFSVFWQTCLLLFCTAVAAGPVAAQVIATPTPAEDARAILIAGNTEKVLAFTFTQLVPIMEAGFLGQIGQIGQIEGGAELLKQIEAKYPDVQTAFAKRFGELIMISFRAEYPNILDQAAQQYVAEITPANLSVIRAFMESSPGQAMAMAQPEIQQKLSDAGKEIGTKAGQNAAAQLMAEADRYFGTDK